MRFAPILICCGLAGVLSAGCRKQPQVAPPGGSSAPSETADDGAADRGSEMLASAIFQLQPENMGIDSDPKSAVSVLNAWREQTGLIEADRFGFTSDDLAALPQSLLSGEQRERIFATEFSPGDALYIRNTLLAATMSENAAKGKSGELDRVVAIFDYVIRTVTLQPSAVPQLPFPFYEILLLGQGTPDDRAWIFAALLKQQRIDAVVLQSPDDADARLVGALLDGEAYLFDTRLGLPIPAGDQPVSARITRPATYREMVAHPDWWEPLTVRIDQPYPWSSEKLASADVRVISAEESWGGRMKQLESVLPAEALCVLYDPLVESSGLASLTDRIAAANADWTPDRLQFWNHALDVGRRLEEMGQQAQQLQLLLQKFNLPLEAKEVEQSVVDPKTQRLQTVQGLEIKPTRQHLKCRTEQLQGKYAAATAHFLSIRHLAVENPPPELRGNPQAYQQVAQMYALAASDASFWSAVCKLEMGDQEIALTALRDYLKKYRQSDWTGAARTLLALGEADLNRLSDARAAIVELPADDPLRPGLEVLMKRWEQIDAESKSSASDDERPQTEE